MTTSTRTGREQQLWLELHEARAELAQATAAAATWQADYYKLLARADTQTACVSAALTACDRNAAPDDLKGEARRGYQAAQDDVRRAVEAVKKVTP